MEIKIPHVALWLLYLRVTKSSQSSLSKFKQNDAAKVDKTNDVDMNGENPEEDPTMAEQTKAENAQATAPPPPPAIMTAEEQEKVHAKAMCDAYELALEHVGHSIYAHGIWHGYISFLKESKVGFYHI